ncbi:SSI family serine proteinase inhibitor [Nocardia iowensis]|uniref:Subtilase-type protease inhibitor n=1 Tax=Nocardia iowensis TaxID=204891 RepID=A0ABX8RJU6_NOCIO|nr:SSI family serine proteinase inhibitor [Nocardia iowensis]QXN89262.1 subtilase-type protease inhibitor [Nocardia iowensis]
MTTSTLRRTVASVCLAVVTLALSVACADNDSEPSKTTLDLTVSAGESPGVNPTRVTLTCDPPGGSHTDAAAACVALAAAGGDFDKLVGDPVAVCAQIYDPVTATATGTWQGKTIKWEKQFGNTCELRAKTTPVF